MPVAAYVYSGDWVGDCSRPGCANTEHLFERRYPARPVSPVNRREVRKRTFLCSNCQQLDTITWPEDGFMSRVSAVLSLRPVPQNRNWYPADHPVALAFHLPHGQTVGDLAQENLEHGLPAGQPA